MASMWMPPTFQLQMWTHLQWQRQKLNSALYGQIALSHAQGVVTPIVPVVVPQDTAAVSAARAQHEALFGHLAQINSQVPIDVVRQVPVESAAVSEQRTKFADQFAAIAEEHARIAKEHALLAEQEERERSPCGATFSRA